MSNSTATFSSYLNNDFSGGLMITDFMLMKEKKLLRYVTYAHYSLSSSSSLLLAASGILDTKIRNKIKVGCRPYSLQNVGCRLYSLQNVGYRLFSLQNVGRRLYSLQNVGYRVYSHQNVGCRLYCLRSLV